MEKPPKKIYRDLKVILIEIEQEESKVFAERNLIRLHSLYEEAILSLKDREAKATVPPFGRPFNPTIHPAQRSPDEIAYEQAQRSALEAERRNQIRMRIETQVSNKSRPPHWVTFLVENSLYFAFDLDQTIEAPPVEFQHNFQNFTGTNSAKIWFLSQIWQLRINLRTNEIFYGFQFIESIKNGLKKEDFHWYADTKHWGKDYNSLESMIKAIRNHAKIEPKESWEETRIVGIKRGRHEVTNTVYNYSRYWNEIAEYLENYRQVYTKVRQDTENQTPTFSIIQ